ncbi:sensor histidine kinase [Gillisia mitskevichiae]|nr:HAMP domain-containing sensor histidine kinase [Gillisia mitskevichiae]
MHKKDKPIKLLRKASKSFLLLSAVLMIASTIALYFYTKNLLKNEVEEELFSTEARIESAIKINDISFSLPPVIEVVEVKELEELFLKDTLIYDPSQNEDEVFRELSTFKRINGKNYRITVRNLVVESKDILIAIDVSYFIIILLVFLFLFYSNVEGNRKLWFPFFKNLEAMKNFSVKSEKQIVLVDSDILEFQELSNEISLLTNKVQDDYQNLKQLTEDVSHEMQTPLAIMQAKIENIINTNKIDDDQYKLFSSLQKDIQRLKQLIKRLTLLTKIENNQFINIDKVDIAASLGKTIQNFKELFNLEIGFQYKHPLFVSMDPYLVEVLCNNLISNAVKHDVKKDEILVSCSHNSMIISNSGEKQIENPEKLFNRFYRESKSNQSTGLGLAIVKKICDLYGFEISYKFHDARHIFTVNFRI